MNTTMRFSRPGRKALRVTGQPVRDDFSKNSPQVVDGEPLKMGTDIVDRSEIRRSPVEVGSKYPTTYKVCYIQAVVVWDF